MFINPCPICKIKHFSHEPCLTPEPELDAIMSDFHPTEAQLVQEALSRKYSDDIVILLPLRDGTLAVFNAARTLCGFIDIRGMPDATRYIEMDELWDAWSAPAKPPKLSTSPTIDLEELDL